MEEDELSFVKLAALTANILSYLKLDEGRDADSNSKRSQTSEDKSNAEQKRSPVEPRAGHVPMRVK